MSKKKERRRRDEQRLRYAKATVGAVLEQSSEPELAVLIRFFEHRDFDAFLKLSILVSAAYDIRAARRNERASERKSQRVLNRQNASIDEPPVEKPLPENALPLV